MRILIAGGETPINQTLSGVLGSLRPGAQTAVADDFPQTVARVTSERWDLVAVDLLLPGMAGLAGLIQLVNASPDSAVMVMADGHAPEVHRLCRVCGIQGLIERSADADHAHRVVSMVLRGGLAFPETLEVTPSQPFTPPPTALTAKQLMVLSQLAEGKSNKQIAKDLDLSPNTVKAHVSEVLRRLGVTSRAEAIVLTRDPLRKA